MGISQVHQYTVTTPQGDVSFQTNKHHSVFSSIEEFLRAHHETIATILGVSRIALQGVSLYIHINGRKERVR